MWGPNRQGRLSSRTRCRPRRWRRCRRHAPTGNQAGLVVLATGLGKTWLSAFDTNRPEFRRVLFVAHREEILNQAHDTFRRIRPGANLGHYTGDKKERQRGCRVRLDPDPQPA